MECYIDGVPVDVIDYSLESSVKRDRKYRQVLSRMPSVDLEFRIDDCVLENLANKDLNSTSSKFTITRPTRLWQFPKDRFVEWDEYDLEWAVPLKYGKWVDAEQTIEFDGYVSHPEVSGMVDPIPTVTANLIPIEEVRTSPMFLVEG